MWAAQGLSSPPISLSCLMQLLAQTGCLVVSLCPSTRAAISITVLSGAAESTGTAEWAIQGLIALQLH